MAGKLSPTDYPIVKKHLSNLEELTEKIEQISWNPVYLVPQNSQNE